MGCCIMWTVGSGMTGAWLCGETILVGAVGLGPLTGTELSGPSWFALDFGTSLGNAPVVPGGGGWVFGDG